MGVITRVHAPRRRGGRGYLDALRRAISHLSDGYATFHAGLSRARRRELIRRVFARHREHGAFDGEPRAPRGQPSSGHDVPRRFFWPH